VWGRPDRDGGTPSCPARALKTAAQVATVAASKHMHVPEFRRFLESDVERQLSKYGMIASQRFDNYGLYLCGTA